MVRHSAQLLWPWPSRCVCKTGDMEHPKRIGDRSTLAVMLALHDAGFDLLLPFGENTRYDLVVVLDSRLVRVQCKTGRLRNGAVFFAPCSAYGHHRNPQVHRRDYADQIDYFAVYCPETGGVYFIPIEDVPSNSSAALRVTPALNGQAKKIRLASTYEVASVTVGSGGASSGPAAWPGAGGSCA